MFLRDGAREHFENSKCIHNFHIKPVAFSHERIRIECMRQTSALVLSLQDETWVHLH